MVDDLFQGGQGQGGTHNAIMSSTDYLSTVGVSTEALYPHVVVRHMSLVDHRRPSRRPQARKSFNNIEDGFYISPAFLDKMTIHIAKNFMDLPKIKVPTNKNAPLDSEDGFHRSASVPVNFPPDLVT